MAKVDFGGEFARFRAALRLAHEELREELWRSKNDPGAVSPKMLANIQRQHEAVLKLMKDCAAFETKIRGS